MPAIIAPADFDAWLSVAAGPEELLRLFPAEAMEAYPVSRPVGNVRSEELELIEPVVV